MLRTIATGAVLSLTTIAASAHHSDAAFDPRTLVALQGVVKQFNWDNPHIRLYLDVRDASGRTATWAIQGNPPGRIRGRGLKDAITTGSHVTVTGQRARDASQLQARGLELTLADGRRFIIGTEP